MREFGHNGKAGTCLWCGKRFKESAHTLWSRSDGSEPENLPEAGDTITVRGKQRVVRLIIPRVYVRIAGNRGRTRKARSGESPTQWDIYFDPPRWDAWWSDDPRFDTKDCALQWALRNSG